MKSITIRDITGLVVDSDRISLQFFDPHGQEWEVGVPNLELFVLKELLSRMAISRTRIDSPPLIEAARDKYGYLFEFPDP